MDPINKMYLILTGKTIDSRTRRDRALKFPVKLMYVLQCGEYDDTIQWCPNGEAFVITNTKNFEERVLPDIFKEAKFSSFDRKLKRWGFEKVKINRGTKAYCYGHPNFRSGDFDQCNAMSLTSQKESLHRESNASNLRTSALTINLDSEDSGISANTTSRTVPPVLEAGVGQLIANNNTASSRLPTNLFTNPYQQGLSSSNATFTNRHMINSQVSDISRLHPTREHERMMNTNTTPSMYENLEVMREMNMYPATHRTNTFNNSMPALRNNSMQPYSSSLGEFRGVDSLLSNTLSAEDRQQQLQQQLAAARQNVILRDAYRAILNGQRRSNYHNHY